MRRKLQEHYKTTL